jgi:two-component system cell cycle sensor histidine kinase/response regulator CckA
MKPEVVFGLENAAWPALLVNAGGAVLLANSAAKAVFGNGLNGNPAQLNAIWSSENKGTASDFLALWLESQPAVTVLKFRTTSDASASFTTAICQFSDNEKRWIVLQLLSGVTTMLSAPAEHDTVVKQKLDCMLQLARTMSLDFNNALTGVLAHTSLLLGKAEPGHPWRLSLMEVEKAAGRAAEITTELAQFSRQEKEVRRAPAGNLNSVVTRCVDAFRASHGTRFTWNLAFERFLYEARFDEVKLQQAITKILENAVESFGLSGTGPITVQTRNVELTQATQDRNVRLAAGTYVCVEVSDSGSGIDSATMARIFEPFFTTKRPPHRGLGLALVYGIVTNHGGGVAISGEPGKGASARIYLPAEKNRILETTVSDQSLVGSGTVLVVDDESLMLTMAETILSDFGYKVLPASNGQAALNILAQPGIQIDLVITDLVMPGMGGRELIERIRQQTVDLPILCMSGYVMPDDKQSVSGYLLKPFTSTQLLQKVKAMISPVGGS